jgi:DNA-binding transcriptional LysR family regulator
LISLHQLRCFLATFEHGSFTAAAAELGLAQPSISEQVRLLEQGLDAPLFDRVGRGLVPTEAARALRPHAERALTAVTEAGRAVASVRDVLEGTIRFGVFGTARLYLGSALVADVLREHPRVRLELIGQHSTEVLTDLRHGRLEAAVIALPIADEGLQVQPLIRDEVVYVSADPARVRKPVTATELAAAPLVLSEASWGNEDSTRRQLARAVQSVGGTLRPRIEVEDIETRPGGGRPRARRHGHRPGPAARAGRPALPRAAVGVAAAADLRRVRGGVPAGRHPVTGQPGGGDAGGGPDAGSGGGRRRPLISPGGRQWSTAGR